MLCRVQAAVAKSGKSAVQGAVQAAVQNAVAKSGQGAVQGISSSYNLWEAAIDCNGNLWFPSLEP